MRSRSRWAAGALIVLLLAGAALAPAIGPAIWRRISVYSMQAYLPDGGQYVHYHCKRWGSNKHRLHGLYTQWFWREGPKNSEGMYVDGEMDGLWTYWNDRGEIVRQDRYASGKLLDGRSAPPWWEE